MQDVMTTDGGMDGDDVIAVDRVGIGGDEPVGIEEDGGMVEEEASDPDLDLLAAGMPLVGRPSETIPASNRSTITTGRCSTIGRVCAEERGCGGASIDPRRDVPEPVSSPIIGESTNDGKKGRDHHDITDDVQEDDEQDDDDDHICVSIINYYLLY